MVIVYDWVEDVIVFYFVCFVGDEVFDIVGWCWVYDVGIVVGGYVFI